MYRKISGIICILFLLFSCNSREAVPGLYSIYSFIPSPSKVREINGEYRLRPNCVICSDLQFIQTAGYLKDILEKSTAYAVTIVQDRKETADIHFCANEETNNPERYILKTGRKGVFIYAGSGEGIFYGCQTLLQLFQPEIFSETPVYDKELRVPFIEIDDYPEYSWRGVILDTARHFFEVEDVKRLIDLMAMHKLNRLHLHLSNDQGFRLQIDSYPDLTLKGSVMEVGSGSGGFYTKEEYTEITEYAFNRAVRIIPEIDFPSHCNAVLASCPELGQDNNTYDFYNGREMLSGFISADKESTYIFLENVIREIAEITPYDYIHIGGDEAEEMKDEDYIYFIKRAESIIQSFGKRMIGWEEITKARPAETTAVQFWKDDQNLEYIRNRNNEMIFSLAEFTYMDMKYSPLTEYGL